MGALRITAGLLTATSLLALGGAASAQTVQTLAAGNVLRSFSVTAPGTATRSVAITGVAAGTSLSGIDYRPASPRVLYSISNVGQLYAINSRTGVASAIGTPAVPTIGAIGFDFNPTVDRIRVITQVGQDVRVNPDTGALAATDGSLAYAAGDANFRQVPTAAGAAYTNSVAGATATTLYVIDTRSGLAAARLVTQGNVSGTVSPNTGSLFTVGSTGVTTTGSVGFDISRDGVAYASLTNPTSGVTSLYSVNLTTGAATLLGAFAGNTTYNGLAVQLASFASMGATANQAAVGGVLDGFTGLPSGQTLQLFNAIDGGYATVNAQPAALLALTPAVYSNLPDISLNAVESQETTIERTAMAIRGGTMGDGSRATLDGDGKIGAWLSGGSRFGRYKGAVDRYGADSDEYHFMGGGDYRLMPNFAVGLFGGYSSTNVHLGPNGSHGGLQSGFGGGYAAGSLGPVAISTWGSYTDLRWGLARNVTIGTFTDLSSARTKGRVWAGGGKVGLPLTFGGFDIVPSVAGRYADIHINGFTEQGGPTALSISRFDQTSIRANAGASIGKTFEFMGATIKPSLHGGWYHEFQDREHTIRSAFLNTSLSGQTFDFATTPLRKNYYNAGGSLNVGGSGPVSMFMGYDAQFDKDREFYNMTLGIRMAL